MAMHLKSIPLTLFLTMVALAIVGAPRPVESAQCVYVSLLDANGDIVPTDIPVVGMILGGVHAIQGDFPPHVSTAAGTRVPCPQIIVDHVTNLFSEACTTIDRRAAAAQMYGVGMEVITKGCKDMAAALNEKK
jgi:hypothetical protein